MVSAGAKLHLFYANPYRAQSFCWCLVCNKLHRSIYSSANHKLYK